MNRPSGATTPSRHVATSAVRRLRLRCGARRRLPTREKGGWGTVVRAGSRRQVHAGCMAQYVSLSHALSQCSGWVRTGGLAAVEQPDVLEPHVDLRPRPNMTRPNRECVSDATRTCGDMHERAYDREEVVVVEWNVGIEQRQPWKRFSATTDFSTCGGTHLSVVLVVQRGEVHRRRLGHYLDGVCVLHVRDGVLGNLRLYAPHSPLRSGPNRRAVAVCTEGRAHYRLPLRLENGPI